MRKNSIKNTRINEEVKKTLAEILRDGLKDPRVHPFTSVVEAEVAPDLKTCKVYVSVLGSKEETKETLQGLNSASGYIRGQLASRLNMRNTPELRFIMDASIAYGVEMSKKIGDVIKDDTDRALQAGREASDIGMSEEV